MKYIILIIILFVIINALLDDIKKFIKKFTKSINESIESINKSIKSIKIKSPSEVKGEIGEKTIIEELSKLPGDYRIVKNIYIRKKDRNWTEIDVVAIHETGIYVFESKNYSGWIFGSEEDRYWTQTFGKGRSRRFPNPIWQNKGHVDAIREKVSTGIPIYSFVVFIKPNLKKADYNETDYLKVLELKDLKQAMTKHTKRQNHLTKTQINNLHKKLEGFQNPPQYVIEQHKKQIEKRFNK